MYRRNVLWCRFVAVVLALVLLASVLTACGGGGKEEETPTLSPTSTATTVPTATATPTATAFPTATPTPTAEGPVKIGAICSWSGPAAMSGIAYADNIIKLVEKQVRDMGGILGGREVHVVKYDNRASVPEAVAGATKLLFDDGVLALTLGGVSAAECEAVAAFAEENHILFTPYSSITGLANMKYVDSAMPPIETYCQAYIDLAIKIAKAKTIGFLAAEVADVHVRVKITKDAVQAAGIKVVYEDYVTLGTSDYTPYLTRLKYANPDVAILESNMGEFFVGIAKQIPDIGGLGDMKVGCHSAAEAVMSKPVADGWYLTALWYPGLNNPGSVKFVNDYKAMFGRMPGDVDVYFYNSLWLSVVAIDKAGTTDREKIAQLVRSGQLEWESPMGHGRWGTDGLSDLGGFLVQIKDKDLVFVAAEALKR